MKLIFALTVLLVSTFMASIAFLAGCVLGNNLLIGGGLCYALIGMLISIIVAR